MNGEILHAKGDSNMFQKFFSNLSARMSRFMMGRYGTDKLNMVILCAGLVVSLISVFIPHTGVNLILTMVSYGLMIWAICRCFSRNVYKRYQENRKFLQILDRLKDRDHRYFDCPKCHQPVRVPRGKGKICITCPRCKERFVRKT